jgi:hypothetical protein
MRTKNFFVGLLSVFASVIFAQDRTTVTATSNDISENLDLRAVASIFGDSRDLEDFERRLNDPRTQISNLDLNQDYQVDYLRVVENVDGYTHLIIIQAVLGRDLFQDVATIEVERGRDNVVQVQVVGDVFMYGPNYIYEPVYVSRPVIFTNFWITNYRPYCSTWYWGYYPTYFVAWRPMPVFRYVNHIHVHINHHHHYNYVHHRRSTRAVAMHSRYRASGYEQRHPDRAFAVRQSGVRNAYELQSNTTRQATGGVRTAPTKANAQSNIRQSSNTGGVRQAATTNGGVRQATQNTGKIRQNGNVRQAENTGGTRSVGNVRSSSTIRSGEANTGGVRSANVKPESSVRTSQAGTQQTVRPTTRQSTSVPSVRGANTRQSSMGNVRQASAGTSRTSSQPSIQSSQNRGNDRSFAQQRSSQSRGNESRSSGRSEGGRR